MDISNNQANITKIEGFTLEELRVSQDYTNSVGVKKLLNTVPIRKPEKTWFVRTHPSPEYQMTIMVVTIKEDNETYLVSPAMCAELQDESACQKRMLVTTVNRQGNVFLWPLRLPDQDGKLDTWGQSELEAAEFAKSSWIRVQADKSNGAYMIWQATGQLGEPKWPEESYEKLLSIAFKGRGITSVDHPIVKRLRGAA